MQQQEQLAFIEKSNHEALEIIKSKGHDYAGVDVLQNFKQMHVLLSVLKVWI